VITSRELDNRSEPSVRQVEILAFVTAYQNLTGQSCPISVICERFQLKRSTVREHLDRLHERGWLMTRGSPVVSHQGFLARR
jgi:DNA-binding IclR family transcriptional regulator